MQFTPPYIRQGLYAIELRKLIEVANRATLLAIFERRKKAQQAQAWADKILAMHKAGIHMPGFCPHCPANVYYD